MFVSIIIIALITGIVGFIIGFLQIKHKNMKLKRSVRNTFPVLFDARSYEWVDNLTFKFLPLEDCLFSLNRYNNSLLWISTWSCNYLNLIPACFPTFAEKRVLYEFLNELYHEEHAKIQRFQEVQNEKIRFKILSLKKEQDV